MKTPANQTAVYTYWMIAVFTNGKWDYDVGQFVDREHANERIAEYKTRATGSEYFPYRCTETITKEYDAQ